MVSPKKNLEKYFFLLYGHTIWTQPSQLYKINKKIIGNVYEMCNARLRGYIGGS